MSDRGGRRGGGAARGGGQPRDILVSKKMSKLLRHDAESHGLKLGPGGYVNLKDVLDTRLLRSLHVTLSEVRELVASNDKQRFSLVPVKEDQDQQGIDQDDPANFLIRANQGHSIKFEDDGLLTAITLEDQATLPATVVHGTTHFAWLKILASGGLKPMGRNHVHFAAGLPAGFKPLEDDAIKNSEVILDGEDEMLTPPAQGDPSVISGMRNSSSILIYIDLPAALKAGIKFGRSENGVILSQGNEQGMVPTTFFKRVEDRKLGDGVLMADGEIVKELPEHVGKGGGEGGRGRGRGRWRGRGA